MNDHYWETDREGVPDREAEADFVPEIDSDEDGEAVLEIVRE